MAIILVFISEIQRLLDYQDKYGVSWDSYQCFGYLTLNSPNTKNLFLDIFIKMHLKTIQGNDQDIEFTSLLLLLWPYNLLRCSRKYNAVFKYAAEQAKEEPIISSNWIIKQIIYVPLIYIYFPTLILPGMH